MRFFQTVFEQGQIRVEASESIAKTERNPKVHPGEDASAPTAVLISK